MYKRNSRRQGILARNFSPRNFWCCFHDYNPEFDMGCQMIIHHTLVIAFATIIVVLEVLFIRQHILHERGGFWLAFTTIADVTSIFLNTLMTIKEFDLDMPCLLSSNKTYFSRCIIQHYFFFRVHIAIIPHNNFQQ